MLACFERSARLADEPIEFVAIPYEQTTLPALFHRAPGRRARPAMIHFDGFDVTKEWMELCGIAREFAARGISTLMVDHPGIGAALRLQGLADESRHRALGRGGDGLARAAPRGRCAPGRRGRYEPRRLLRAARGGVRAAPRRCVAWGARWDNAGSHGRILRDPDAARSVTGWLEHALWYYGAATADEA